MGSYRKVEEKILLKGPLVNSTWAESWTKVSIGRINFTAFRNSKPVQIIVNPGSGSSGDVRAILVFRGQIDLSDERIRIATTAAAKFLLWSLICVIEVAVFHDEVNGSTDREVFGERLNIKSKVRYFPKPLDKVITYRKVIQHVRIFRHREFLIQSDFDARGQGNRSAKPTEEDDHNDSSHGLGQDEWRISVLE